MLKLKNITKDYVTKQQTVNVLKGISLNFRQCEFVTILGQSGCGKTTLLNIVGGLDRYTSGDILINGKSTKDFDNRDWDKYRNKQIGFVFQNYNLIPHLSVLRNVELALTLAGKKKNERENKALDALRQVGLDDQAYKKPNQLSGGQMQRVAIARALVNNPDIILADEPTGALDSESGTMVMELLKEVAKDRLVILVSHNAELARNYSTRTVVIKDGKITSDSNPFYDETDEEIEEETIIADDSKKTVRQRIKKTYKQIVKERKEERKVSMNGATTIGLSARNLYSKKWRTFLTSFAGSIGIIGIALVLALSSGVKNYIAMTEQSTLSLYPISISNKSVNITQIAEMLMKSSTGQIFPQTTNTFINSAAGNLLMGADGTINIENLDRLIKENDLPAIKKYLDNTLNSEDGYAQYKYSSEINIYRKIPLADGTYANSNYTKVNPFVDSISSISTESPIEFNSIVTQFESYLDLFSVFSELIDSQEILNKQYDVIAGEWPNKEGYTIDDLGNKVFECVIKVDEYNKIPDYMLFAAGLVHPSEVGDMFGIEGDGSFAERVFSAEELLDVEYSVLADCDYYDFNSITNEFTSHLKGDDLLKTKDTEEFINSHSKIKMKVVGIVRPRENATAASIAGIVGYPNSLIEEVVARCQNSEIVNAQLHNYYYREEISPGEYTHTKVEDLSSMSEEELNNVYIKHFITNTYTINSLGNPDALEQEIIKYVKNWMGYAKLENPEEIFVFASSFEGKENILKVFKAYENSDYNPKKGSTIKYADIFATIMEYVKQLTNAMISALIAFSAISLIVSSIMIAIITYTSVLERRKEIGVLRSIGARKLDISNLFISESSIIGIISGLFGISFGYLFVFIANVALESVLDIPKLMHLNWYFAISLVIISFLLSLIAGIVPASIAANKDPVEALRTE